MQRPPRGNLVTTACYFVFACAALAFQFFVVAVNSQGVTGNVSLTFIFAAVVTSPIPTLLVGATFLRDSRWATACAVALALFQAAAFGLQLHVSDGRAVSGLTWPRQLFYLCPSRRPFIFPGRQVWPSFQVVRSFFDPHDVR